MGLCYILINFNLAFPFFCFFHFFMAKLLQLGTNGEAIISRCLFMRVSKGLTVSHKTAKILAARRKIDKF